MTMANLEAQSNASVKNQQVDSLQTKVSGKPGSRRSEGTKRSLVRKIRIKIGGKVADIFTW
ncbi:MAG TPA: hypothetical protein VFF64_27665 [Candidatus Eremiobacteraceae bacterium]|nr:hypothetical protein [Candidatus Eremiobacteraceae bacterium]